MVPSQFLWLITCLGAQGVMPKRLEGFTSKSTNVSEVV
jgi:hypothetical protein